MHKYGDDDHIATVSILNELKCSQSIIDHVANMDPLLGQEIARGNSWELKILLYSDLRVGPSGIVTLSERIEDLFSRYEKYKTRPYLCDAYRDIESHIMRHLKKALFDSLSYSPKSTETKKLLRIVV